MTHATLVACVLAVHSVSAQVDQKKAAAYFAEVARACEREGGRTWGTSLCGPLAIVDGATKTIATSVPAPAIPQPGIFGYANMALDRGGQRWSSVVWQLIPEDEHARDRLFTHELFHRVQPKLGFIVVEGHNDHLDTVDGRYWLQLEWRALAMSLAASRLVRAAAVRDALAFRERRRVLFPEARENERVLEINEGLAQYTATVVASPSHVAAVTDAIGQLANAPLAATLDRTFPSPSGAAYGLLLDAWTPGWPRRIHASDDLGEMLKAASRLRPADDADPAAKRYGGVELHLFEVLRD